jgi:hypothetical protein
MSQIFNGAVLRVKRPFSASPSAFYVRSHDAPAHPWNRQSANSLSLRSKG